MAEIDLILKGLVVDIMQLTPNDKLVTIITDQKGKISFLAKRLNLPNSKIAKGANLFCYGEFSFTRKNGSYWPVEITILHNFHDISKNVGALSLASYFAEVACSVCQPENDESLMLKLLLNSLFAVENSIKPRWMIKAAFEMQAMRCLGFMPNHDECCYCGEELPEKPSSNVVFETAQGGFACEKCTGNEDFKLSSDSFVLPPNSYSAVKYVSYSNSKKMLHYYLPDKYVAPFIRACEHFVIVQTERKYRTLDDYNKNYSKE